MKRTTKGIPILLMAAFLNWAGLPRAGAGAAVINLNFGDAATAADDGPQDGVFDAFTPFNFGSVNNNGYTSFRTVLEFDVSALPPGSTIKSATLTMFVDFVEGTRSVALDGYAGDGTVQLEDFSRDGLVGGAILDPPGSRSVVFDVTGFIASLAAVGEHFAGFNVREDPANNSNFTVFFFEMAGPNSPQLSIEFEAITDADGDGVPDVSDLCPGTPPGAVVDADGCSIEQLASCSGPAAGGTWRDHGAYVSAVVKVAEQFLASGLITAEEKGAISAAAARSRCGK